MTRPSAVLLAAVLAAGCATPAGVGPRPMGFDEPPYRIGALRIWIRPQPEVEVLCRMAGADIARQYRVLGCYIADSQTIIAIDDAWVVMHEMKHFFEGPWHDDPARPH